MSAQVNACDGGRLKRCSSQEEGEEVGKAGWDDNKTEERETRRVRANDSNIEKQ